MNIKFQNGFTPLHIAAQEGQVEIVKLLIEHPDCDINARSESGKTALDVACSPEIREILLPLYAKQAKSASASEPVKKSKGKRKSKSI